MAPPERRRPRGPAQSAGRAHVKVEPESWLVQVFLWPVFRDIPEQEQTVGGKQ